jgi:hypothetical protein
MYWLQMFLKNPFSGSKKSSGKNQAGSGIWGYPYLRQSFKAKSLLPGSLFRR